MLCYVNIDLDGLRVYLIESAFLSQTKSWTFPQRIKQKLSHLSSCHAFLPASLSRSLLSLSSLSFSGWCLQFKAHTAPGRGLNLPSMLQRRPWGEVWLRCSKPRVKKRIDRIKQVKLLHILYHTHPADLGIALQMKRRHKFERRESEWERREEEGRAQEGRMKVARGEGKEERERRKAKERKETCNFCRSCMIKLNHADSEYWCHTLFFLLLLFLLYRFLISSTNPSVVYVCEEKTK